MKVLLISIDLVMGVRVLVNVLKEKGHQAHSLQIKNIKYTDCFSEKTLKDIHKFSGAYDVVGLSYNSFNSILAAQLARYLKAHGTRWVIAGGPHPTAMPEEVLSCADIVLIFEGERTLPKLLDQLNKVQPQLKDVPGIYYTDADGKIVKTGCPEIEYALDKLPFQTFSPEDITFYNYEEKKFETPTIDTVLPHAGRTWIILASRGCPFNCTYCSNNLFAQLDRKFIRVRKRSVPNIIAEMRMAKEAGFRQFYITDDNFFAFTLEEIREFAGLYKEQIQLPFSVVGIHPNNMKTSDAAQKVDLLLNSGLSDVRVGVQSGSPKTLEIFNRKYDPKKLPELLKSFAGRKTIWPKPNDKLRVAIDFICDSPWEEEKDKLDTLILANELLPTYGVFFYTLIYLPGTEIYQMALKKGWIQDHQRDIYLRGIAGVEDNIYNRLLFLIAVLKERGSKLPVDVITHIIEIHKTNPLFAESFVDGMMAIVNDVEGHHGVKDTHMSMHPYLKGFKKWEKTVGEKGKKVLFRSYHAAYG